ncbi:hypothetical protein BFP71_17170 [Roseivirga misakiensis]|uniref:Uncharacterized protein n=1 Tax=Roseivirga misakiensis TaxID=1563681 RepID=A0A1E5T1A8_9BACT|nr:hypothetical protein BFP71_17170 [Roseivirga misakiensis]
MAFIACQNYINSSIYDRYGSIDDKLILYKMGREIVNGGRTEIELIIAVANYYKHRDDKNPLHRGTREVLNDLKLNFSKTGYPENLPIIIGAGILSPSFNLDDFTKIVTDWRELLWLND